MLAIFDVEGVLYDAEYLPLLAEKVNKENQIWEITKKGIEGKIDWVKGLKERVHLLRGIDYVSYIHLTLPTIYHFYITAVAVHFTN